MSSTRDHTKSDHSLGPRSQCFSRCAHVHTTVHRKFGVHAAEVCTGSLRDTSSVPFGFSNLKTAKIKRLWYSNLSFNRFKFCKGSSFELEVVQKHQILSICWVCTNFFEVVKCAPIF